VSGQSTQDQVGQFRGHQWAETVAISGLFRDRLWAVFHGRRQLREKARAREIPHLRLGPAKIMFRATDVRAILDLSAVVPDPVDRHADAPQTDAEIADLETLGLDPRSLARRRGGIRRRA